MAIPNKTLAGFQYSLTAQSAASPTPVTPASLGTFASVTGAAFATINVEEIPEFGFDDASASFGVAGSRFSDKIVTQSAPTSLTITAAFNPSDVMLQTIRNDAVSGVTERTYTILATDGANVQAFAFNARVGQFKLNPAVGAEVKATFTLHPRGGADWFGFSNNP